MCKRGYSYTVYGYFAGQKFWIADEIGENFLLVKESFHIYGIIIILTDDME
jgi:hypothetical protein